MFPARLHGFLAPTILARRPHACSYRSLLADEGLRGALGPLQTLPLRGDGLRLVLFARSLASSLTPFLLTLDRYTLLCTRPDAPTMMLKPFTHPWGEGLEGTPLKVRWRFLGHFRRVLTLTTPSRQIISMIGACAGFLTFG